MKNNNEVLNLTFEFALRIIDTYNFLCKNREFVMSKQLLRCGTSIGANVNEAQVAQSKKDFIAKMSIASNESRETAYWLRLLKASDYLDGYNNYNLLIDDINSIIKIITSIVNTAQNNS